MKSLITLFQNTHPDITENSNIIPVHKKNDKQLIQNYRPISLLPNSLVYINRSFVPNCVCVCVGARVRVCVCYASVVYKKHEKLKDSQDAFSNKVHLLFARNK